jgi:hypothetical protein
MAIVTRRGVTVRKYFYAGTLVAAALVAAVPAASAAAAAAAPVHVLTTVRAGGPAVATGAVLKASLKVRTSAVFKTTLGTVTCTTSTFTAKVVSNPVKPGTAKESITAETFGSCKSSIGGVTIKSSTPGNLPYNATISDARGHPVKISGHSTTKPLLVTVTVKFGTSTFNCSIKAASISGTSSNTGNVVVFVNQKFTKAAGGTLCPSSGTFSATYGPVRDSSVRGNPAVFVN